jgi:hypothetical protein
VTEPIPPDSQIFGSAWYTAMLAKHGPTKDTKWLAEVMKLQTTIQEEYHGHIDMPIIPQPLVNQPVKIRKPRKVKRVESVPTSIITYITPPKRKYLEAEGPVSMLPTDEYSLSIQTINGEEVYACENGMVFRIIQKEPGPLLGWCKNGSFRPV